MLRSLVDAKKIAANEQLNAIILRDTADKVKVAERMIETNDKAQAEVVIDVELLQINTAQGCATSACRCRSYNISQSARPGLDVDTAAGGTQIGFDDLEFLNQSSWVAHHPDLHLRLRQEQQRRPGCWPSRSCASARARRRR